MSWQTFINKIKPDGKAFGTSGLLNYTQILFDVMATAFQIAVDYANLHINDQVWYVNENFDPVPWEARYGITPPEFATLTQRREVVRAYMLYPQSSNRLSLDYMQGELDNLGIVGATLSYNSTGASTGLLHANDFADEKAEFSLGALTYNSFIASGSIDSNYYNNIIKLLLSLKPLQVALYDQLEAGEVLAYDEDYALAIDDDTTLAILTL
jgi:hypothetical protein